MGSKKTLVYAVDPHRGDLLQRFDDSPGFSEAEFQAQLLQLPGPAEKREPRGDEPPVYIGRTEYIVKSVDQATGRERWNVTYAKLTHLPPSDVFGGEFFGGPEAPREAAPTEIQLSFGGRDTLHFKDGNDRAQVADWRTKFSSTPLFASFFDAEKKGWGKDAEQGKAQ